jgi:putative SOS response-associated peptidase YedK
VAATSSPIPFREIVRFYNLTQANASRFDNMPARYNIAPTQDVAVVCVNAEDQRDFVMLRWGLIPCWSKDAKGGFSTINAMSETLDQKPAFREPFEKAAVFDPRGWFLRVAAHGREEQATVFDSDGG